MTISSPLCVIDVGNSASSLALYPASIRRRVPRPMKVMTVTTGFFLAQGPEAVLRRLLRSGPIAGAAVSSVVPAINARLRRALRRRARGRILFVSHKTDIGMPLRYRKPVEIGADRIVNAREALALGPAPAVVIDFGTATTFDVVSRKGAFLGGVIAPGPGISAEALFRKTAKLPHVPLKRPSGILGRSTVECMQAGLYFGYVGLCREILRRLTAVLGTPRIYVTGGQAGWVAPDLGFPHRRVPRLTLDGLWRIWTDGCRVGVNRDVVAGRNVAVGGVTA